MGVNYSLSSNSVMFQISQTFLLLSNLQVNLLYFRVTLSFASLCFAIWGIVWIHSYATFLYNLIYVVINLLLSVQGIHQIFIRFKSKEEANTFKIFKKYMEKYTFIQFIRSATKFTVSQTSTLLKKGDSYKLFMIPSISNNAKLYITLMDGSKKHIKEFPAFICYPYFLYNRSYSKYITTSEIDVNIEISEGAVDYYIFNEQRLKTLMQKSSDLRVGLYQLWLEDINDQILAYNCAFSKTPDEGEQIETKKDSNLLATEAKPDNNISIGMESEDDLKQSQGGHDIPK